MCVCIDIYVIRQIKIGKHFSVFALLVETLGFHPMYAERQIHHGNSISKLSQKKCL